MNIILLITVVVTAIVSIFAAERWLKVNRLTAQLDKERDAHLKASKTNSLLQKANDNAVKEIDRLAEKLESAMSIIDEQRIQIKRLDEKLNYANEVIAALQSKVRQRNAKGQFLPRKASQAELDQAVKDCAKFMDESIDIAKAKPSHRLTHGLTVKNPTEDEAKAIFEAAKRLGIKVGDTKLMEVSPWIWCWMPNNKNPEVFVCGAAMPHFISFVTTSEFIARMQTLKRVTDLGEKEVIHCPTLEEAEAICRLMDEAGLKWVHGRTYKKATNWENDKSQTCYCPSKGQYSPKSFYESNGYTIHQAADFLQTQANKG